MLNILEFFGSSKRKTLPLCRAELNPYSVLEIDDGDSVLVSNPGVRVDIDPEVNVRTYSNPIIGRVDVLEQGGFGIDSVMDDISIT